MLLPGDDGGGTSAGTSHGEKGWDELNRVVENTTLRSLLLNLFHAFKPLDGIKSFDAKKKVRLGTRSDELSDAPHQVQDFYRFVALQAARELARAHMTPEAFNERLLDLGVTQLKYSELAGLHENNRLGGLFCVRDGSVPTIDAILRECDKAAERDVINVRDFVANLHILVPSANYAGRFEKRRRRHGVWRCLVACIGLLARWAEELAWIHQEVEASLVQTIAEAAVKTSIDRIEDGADSDAEEQCAEGDGTLSTLDDGVLRGGPLLVEDVCEKAAIRVIASRPVHLWVKELRASYREYQDKAQQHITLVIDLWVNARVIGPDKKPLSKELASWQNRARKVCHKLRHISFFCLVW